MLRSGDDYRDSLRDGRAVWIKGERVEDVPSHPAFRPIVDVRARIYDLAHEPALRDVLTLADRRAASAGGRAPAAAHRARTGRPSAPRSTPPSMRSAAWSPGSATRPWARCGRSTTARTCSTRSTRASPSNIRRHVERVEQSDLFHVSANTDPKGDRSKRPQEQDPDMLLHSVRETDAGIVVRGAKYETAAAYAHQAFVKPTIANWGDAELSDYAIGFVVPMNAEGLKHICRAGFAGRRPLADYPISNRFDEVDTLLVFDDVLIPWEDVLFYRHTRAASFIRSCLHRYSAFPFVQRIQRLADLMIGAALFNLRQTGLEKQPAVREKLALLACYRETINAHLTAAIAAAKESPAGLLMPNQSLLYSGRVHACSRLPEMMHLTRELCGGQICLTPDWASFESAETNPGWRSSTPSTRPGGPRTASSCSPSRAISSTRTTPATG